jgi:transcriptional regulator with XRE-family HTH domain
MTYAEIKFELDKAGITQKAIAKGFGCSTSHVWKVIRRVAISSDLEEYIASALDIEVDGLFPDRVGKKGVAS